MQRQSACVLCFRPWRKEKEAPTFWRGASEMYCEWTFYATSLYWVNKGELNVLFGSSPGCSTLSCHQVNWKKIKRFVTGKLPLGSQRRGGKRKGSCVRSRLHSWGSLYSVPHLYIIKVKDESTMTQPMRFLILFLTHVVLRKPILSGVT